MVISSRLRDDVVLGLGGTSCTYVWKAVAHRHVSGGLYRPLASTVKHCQEACVNNSNCVGVDFNNAHQCYLITAGLPGQGMAIIKGEDEEQKQETEFGCVHYDLKRTCGLGGLTSASLFYRLRIVILRIHIVRPIFILYSSNFPVPVASRAS